MIQKAIVIAQKGSKIIFATEPRDRSETWKKQFPVMNDLIQVWHDDADMHKKEDGESAIALIRKTYAFEDTLSGSVAKNLAILQNQ